MNQLPSLDIFPLVETRRLSDFERAIGKAEEPPITYPDAEAFIAAAIPASPSTRYDFLIERKLESEKRYAPWRRSCPTSAVVPNVHKYQNDFKNADFALVDQELRTHGSRLPRGQVLFHGGLWRGAAGPNPGDRFTTNHPMSTTLQPSPAIVHSLAHKPWTILVLTITSDEVVALPIHLGRNLAHEAEVLLAAGAQVECTHVRQIGEHAVVFCAAS